MACLVLLTASCGREETNQEPAPEDKSKSREQLLGENRRLKELSAEKDSLLTELMQTTNYITEVYSALASVKLAGGAEAGTQKEQILAKIRQLSANLDETQSKLRKSKSRIQALKKENAGLAQQMSSMEEVLSQLQKQLSDKESEIAELREQATQLREDRDAFRMSAETEAGERTRIENEKNTFYYIIGKADDLEKKGIIDEEGSGFLGIGGTYVPSKNLNEQDFIRVDARTTRTLPIPEKFQIVSSHNPKLLDKNSSGSGMTIIDPARFWTSKFLIIIDKR